MSDIPDNIKDLEEKLQKISGEYIRLDDKEEKRVNKIVGDVLTKVKTIKDEVFQKLYKETRYSGSYYEKLKIENPYEFDINLVLELPIEKDSIIKS
ncbi:hypothetical protein C0J52_07742 [Blattella germanica]|nr:hypothetical protein C0J52_07742 [Blattella germanica]